MNGAHRTGMFVFVALLASLSCIVTSKWARASELPQFDRTLAVASFQSLGDGSDQDLLDRISRTFIIQEIKLLLEPEGIGVYDEPNIASATRTRSSAPLPPRFGPSSEHDYILHLDYSGERNVVFAIPRIEIVKSGETMSISSEEIVIDRTRWNVNYKSKSVFAELRDKYILDEMYLSVDMTIE